jgi:hypothetical protein
MAKFIEFPNGAILDVENISCIVRADINKYAVIPKRAISPNVPAIDGNELDALKKYLDVVKLEVATPGQVVAANG